jgi:hypothetical protein
MRLLSLVTALALSCMPCVVLAAAPTGQAVGPHHVECNVSEVLTEHIHTALRIQAHGHVVPVPANVGIVQAGGTPICFYWLHTHDDSGLIHVEAPMGTFTLADFFAVWGEPLSSTRVGRFTGHVTVTVNGKPWSAAPQDVPLIDGETIVLRVN